LADKLFFLPYSPDHQGIIFARQEYGSGINNTGLNHMRKEIEHELFDKEHANRPYALWYEPAVRNPFLASMNNGNILIRGHGMPGCKSIEGGRCGERVDYNVVVDRLVESGLSRQFNGRIKMFNCHSAEAAEPDGSPECVGTPFAQLMADELSSRGYRSCTFFGYHGAIDSVPKMGPYGKHHYRRIIVRGRQAATGRASEVRQEFKSKSGVRSLRVFLHFPAFGRN